MTSKRKRPLDKSREALTPVHYGTVDIDPRQSPTSVERPKRLTFTELADELTRRSNLE
jgi:hypothetical protein